MSIATDYTADEAPTRRGTRAVQQRSPRRTKADLWDKRRAPWRRRCELIRLFIAELGGEPAMTPALRLQVERAAELATIAEMVRAAFVEGGIGPNDVIRAERVAQLAERRLGLIGKPAKAKTQSVAEYLAQAAERREGADA